MNIGGFQKLTLIDYPGKVATTVFTVGCSFRCSFCHNPELVETRLIASSPGKEQEFFKFLENRKGKLDAVCITGGEPTIQPDIIEFIKKIKAMGFLVKLDSNGTRPDVIKEVIDKRLVSYIAMDIKNIPERYSLTTATKTDIERIKLSVDMIMNGPISYEFRTTVVPGIHEEADILGIARWIKGAQCYYLQRYREVKILDIKLKEITKGKTVDLEKIGKKIAANFQNFGIRG